MIHSRGEQLVGGIGLREGVGFVAGQLGMNRAIDGTDAIEARLRGFAG